MVGTGFIPVPSEVPVSVKIGVVERDAVLHGEIAFRPAPLTGSEQTVVDEQFWRIALENVVAEGGCVERAVEMLVGSTVCPADGQRSVRAAPYRGVGCRRSVIGQYLGGMLLENVQRHGILARMPQILTFGISIVKRRNRAGAHNLVVGDKAAAAVTACDTVNDRFVCKGIRGKHTDNGGLRKIGTEKVAPLRGVAFGEINRRIEVEKLEQALVLRENVSPGGAVVRIQ